MVGRRNVAKVAAIILMGRRKVVEAELDNALQS
jgi:hypothetical protein